MLQQVVKRQDNFSEAKLGKLYNKLIEYSNKDVYPLHMPGHKRVDAVNPVEDPLSAALKLDITEINDFDNLHNANGIILEAEKRVAKLYNSDKTYFLVNGSTVGILAAVSAVSKDKDSIIIARNCHKSVYNSVFLNRLKVHYLYPEYDNEYDINLDINVDKLKQQIEKSVSAGEKVAAVVITSPTYDGISCDIDSISKTVHEYNIPLIVDQAHGSHFGFNNKFPDSAVKWADIVIHSTHKTLPAPTQTALLHLNSSLIKCESVERFLKIYETSSPSYILMAGIDRCFDIVEREATKRLDLLYDYREDIDRVAKDFKALKVCPYTEPGKVVISTKKSAIDGLKLSCMLREEYGLEVEMATSSYVLAILTMMDSKDGTERLIKALTKIDQDISHIDSFEEDIVNEYPRLEKAMEFCDAFDQPAVNLELNKSLGRISARFINLYPPGYPMAVPGEVITKELIDVIALHLNKGFEVEGISNNTIGVIDNG